MKANQDKATATPWRYDETWALITGPKGEEVCAVHSGESDGTQRQNRNTALANAELIVQAVNERAALLAVERTAHAMLMTPGAEKLDIAHYKLAVAISDLTKVRAEQTR